MDQTGWQFIHILLFVFWLGADVGVWLSMWFVGDARLPYATRVTIVRLAFLIDLAPRFAFALMIPVGVELAGGLGLLPSSFGWRALAWSIGIGWCALHAVVVARKGTQTATMLRRINVAFEASAGLVFVGGSLVGLSGLGLFEVPTWFLWKMLLFGTIFLVVLGIDTRFQPFTMLLATAPDGPSRTEEARIRRATHQTLLWALLLYGLILATALLGKLKPF